MSHFDLVTIGGPKALCPVSPDSPGGHRVVALSHNTVVAERRFELSLEDRDMC